MTTCASPILSGRRGLVLGVSAENSVGFQCARRFKELGAEVAISHRPERATALDPLARRYGLAQVEFEATDEASLERAMNDIGARFERLDFLIHTLVHVPDGVLLRSLLDVSAREFAATLDVSVRSLMVACRHALPWLERSDGARVLAFTSAGAGFALPNYHVVGIAKGALEAAVRYLARELGPRGILCNALGFSLVETDAARRALGTENAAKSHEHIRKRSLTRRVTDLEQVADAAAFFASPLCRNVTGEVLTLDGGFSRAYF